MTREPRGPSFAPGSGHDLRIDVVLVEDHEESREMLRELLVSWGMVVRAFAAVAPALDSIRERTPDAVLTDLALPEHGGVFLAESLRRNAATSEVAIVAVSGAVEPSWEVMRWFDAYLRKPIDVAELPRLLQALCRPPAARTPATPRLDLDARRPRRR